MNKTMGAYLRVGFPISISGSIPIASADDSAAVPAGDPEFVSLNWSDHIGPYRVAAFERERGSKIRFVYFEPAVLAASPNKRFAADLSNFQNQPSRAARNGLLVHYAPPNATTEAPLPKQLLSDPKIYPEGEALARSEFYIDLPASIVRLRDDSFTRGILSAPCASNIDSTPDNSQ